MVVLVEEVSTAWRMATVGSKTAAAMSRIRAIFFECLHLRDDSSGIYRCLTDKPMILNASFDNIF